MTERDDAALIGDSSSHTDEEPAPGGGFYQHRLTIRFTGGETLIYTVSEPLHAEDIAASVRFVVISLSHCEGKEKCDELILLNLNDISYIKTQHITRAELEREEATRRELRSDESDGMSHRLARIGFI